MSAVWGLQRFSAGIAAIFKGMFILADKVVELFCALKANLKRTLISMSVLVNLYVGIFLILLSSICQAQSLVDKTQGSEVLDATNKEESDSKAPIYIQKFLPPLDAKKTCKKYEGKVIGYYGKAYIVKNCERIEISHVELKRRVKSGAVITEVDGRVVAALSPKEAAHSLVVGSEVCKKYEGKLVTSSHTDFFLIQNCRKRSFPDWESFASYKKASANSKSRRLHVIKSSELAMLAAGRKMPSVLKKEYHSLWVDRKSEPVVIPLNEACEGLLGKHVTYIDKIYKIETLPGHPVSSGFCHKKIVEFDKFSAKEDLGKLKELNSSEAVSIPDAESR